MATVPDPRQGVFETLLVLDGRPVELEAHLNRLVDSLEELFPSLAPPDLGEAEVEPENGIMRIDVRPRLDRLEAKVSFREPEEPSGPVALHSLALAGGLGPYKWADRSLLEEAQNRLPVDSLPLVVDADGTVLEASRASVFAVRDGALFTPPLDGRILPGVTRARVLEIAADVGVEAAEAELRLDDLLAADEVFLTGSVRGIESVRALDGAPLPPGGEVAAGLAAGLMRTWLGARVG